MIQLGAFANQAQAERAWTALSARFPSVAAMNKMIVPFSGGIRLRAGAASPADAKQACQTLKAAGENCFVAAIMQAAIYGLEGLELTDDERAFFRDADPAGFILFKRNCDNPEQLLRLTDSLRDSDRPRRPADPDRPGGRARRADEAAGMAGFPGGRAVRRCSTARRRLRRSRRRAPMRGRSR